MIYLGIALVVYLAYRVGHRRGYDKHHEDMMQAQHWGRLQKLGKLNDKLMEQGYMRSDNDF
jgi:hypothetical protein